jgi:hypothetical protein
MPSQLNTPTELLFTLFTLTASLVIGGCERAASTRAPDTSTAVVAETPGTGPDGGSPSLPGSKEKPMKNFALSESWCESFFATDPKDAAWASKQEQHLSASAMKVTGVKVLEAECRSRLCRVKLMFDSGATQRGFDDSLMYIDTGFGTNVHRSDPNERNGSVSVLTMHDYPTRTARWWVSRNGYTLPNGDGLVKTDPKPLSRAPKPESLDLDAGP